MSISFYQNHNTILRIMSVVMILLMLISCIATPAKALVTEVGITLIVAILAAFGLVVSTTGAIEGIPVGFSQLLEEFSESVHGSSTWLVDQFSAHLSMARWGVLKIAGELTEAIREFIDWVRNYKSLTPETPITHEYKELVVGDNTYPLTSANRFSLVDPYDYTNDQMKAIQPDPDSFESNRYYVPGGINSDFIFNTINGHDVGISFRPITHNEPYFMEAFYYGTDIPISAGFPIRGNDYVDVFYSQIYEPVQNGWRYNTFAYVGGVRDIGDFGGYVPDIVLSDAGVLAPRPGVYGERDRAGWVLNDDNLDLSYLDNDNSNKDVYFSPSIPNLLGEDLSNIGSINRALEKQLDYTKSLTNTGEITGTLELDRTIELNPDSGGSGSVPPIVIPPTGWFSNIWHYVVKALQDSAAGISFVLNMMYTVIPPQILNLCWASCVLLITFGIVNKFLK